MSHSWKEFVAGAIAGLAATVPMTLFMICAHRQLPRRQRFELPPAKITGNLLRGAGIYKALDTAGPGVSLPSHFGYGSAIGAAYGGVAGQPTLASGLAYGLGIWAASYLGWLPAAGLHRSAAAETRERNLLMIAAHVIWGASFAAIMQRLAPRQETGEEKMNSPDAFTIIHTRAGAAPKTVATGFSRDEAQRWLAAKAAEKGSKVSRDPPILRLADRGETWQAVKAE